MKFKKFRSPNGDPIRVASTLGHIVLIEQELVDVPDVLWPEAYALGAISEDMQVDSMKDFLNAKKKEKEDKELEERLVLKDKLKELLDKPVGYTDKDGRPLVRKVIGFLGEPIKKDLLDSIWDELLEEQEV